MNLKQFSIALLISAIPAISPANSNVSFNHGDFVAVERFSNEGDVALKVKLSKSGKAKLRKINKNK